MPDASTPATALDCEQATLAHHELAEAVNRLAREGFPVSILTAGLAATMADLITCAAGIEQVPRWFAEQALAAQALLDGTA